MCWVAMDRGVRMATSHGRPAPLETWQRTRDAIYDQIMSKGWNAERQAFVQEYDSTVLDSALLRMSPRRVHHADRPDVDLHARRDGLRARHRQPGLPLRPRGLPGRAAGVRGHLLAVHLRVRRRAGPSREGRRRAAGVREDAHLRQPPRPVLRGDRAHRRADRQLPPGLHPPGAHRRRDRAGPRSSTDAGRPGRPGRRRPRSHRERPRPTRIRRRARYDVAGTTTSEGRATALQGCCSRSRWRSSSAASPART